MNLSDENTTVDAVGPLRWMAPEQMSDQLVSVRSDVYSFGCCVYECYAREVPWRSLTPMKAAHEVMLGNRLTLPATVDAPAAVVVEVLEQCTRFDRMTRPSMKEVIRLFEKAGFGVEEEGEHGEDKDGLSHSSATAESVKKSKPVQTESMEVVEAMVDSEDEEGQKKKKSKDVSLRKKQSQGEVPTTSSAPRMAASGGRRTAVW
jgi:serine/threonine protein kinase